MHANASPKPGSFDHFIDGRRGDTGENCILGLLVLDQLGESCLDDVHVGSNQLQSCSGQVLQHFLAGESGGVHADSLPAEVGENGPFRQTVTHGRS